MRFILAVMGVALLAGCATPEVRERTVFQEVYVPVPCSPRQPERPSSAVDALPLNAQIDEQMRALRADRVRLKPYIRQLETALASCQ